MGWLFTQATLQPEMESTHQIQPWDKTENSWKLVLSQDNIYCFFFLSFRFKIPNTLPEYIDIVFEVFIYFMSQMFCRYCIPIPRLLLDRVIYSDRAPYDLMSALIFPECTRIYHWDRSVRQKGLLSLSLSDQRQFARRCIKSDPCFLPVIHLLPGGSDPG